MKRIDHSHGSNRLSHKRRCGFVTQVLFSLLLFPIWLSAAPVADERLEYKISYQGGLTAMVWLDICDAVLETSQQAVSVNGELAYKTFVDITSERYEKMEDLYPFRFHLTSFFSSDMQRSILFDKRKKTKKDRHEVIRFDWEEKVTERYKRLKPKQIAAGATNIKAGENKASDLFNFLGYDLTHFRRSGRPGQKLSTGMLDRLSLLQAVRSQKLTVGEEKRLTISDGKKVLNYLVRVQAREALEHNGQKQDLFKVRFDAFKTGKWSGTPAHPVVYVWMTTDDLRIPVRFSIDYAMGTFVIQLKQKIVGQPAIASSALSAQPSQAH
ncbi:DUF3108 domain-containing protein [Pseudomonadota bacterium]